MTAKWMIYGATGYTGQLIAQKAKVMGHTPIIAGRNAEKVRKLATELELPWSAFSVDDPNAVRAALKNCSAVLSVAGPFSATAEHMMRACIDTNTHYLDVTGEIAVFECAARYGTNAEKAGVTLLPGVGFDVVPSDCLAAHTAKRAKAPKSLVIAIHGLGGPSQGTAKTAVESLGNGTMVREGGTIITKPAGSLKRVFTLNDIESNYLAVSWGDVSTAFYSTGINNIQVYFPAEGPIKTMTTLSRFIGPILKLNSVQSFFKKQIDKMPAGPTEEQRIKDTSTLLAEVIDADGTEYRSILHAPNGYTLTADSAVKSVLKIMEGNINAGFQTPSLAFGASYYSELDGCKLEDI
ncbi:saccharopine dehydrogenase family protein [Kordiimonas aquimaris]|uniref:saccharopine dehydrogenase family protein n=1 Tax=Kordiimonas aquimaris TaxID=707591 RepID=UPI0021D12E4C|nr:saccharopine dehydrogenase NADP-binding domain-containing protein [Kordiimonas aquimaris]